MTTREQQLVAYIQYLKHQAKAAYEAEHGDGGMIQSAVCDSFIGKIPGLTDYSSSAQDVLNAIFGADAPKLHTQYLCFEIPGEALQYVVNNNIQHYKMLMEDNCCIITF